MSRVIRCDRCGKDVDPDAVGRISTVFASESLAPSDTSANPFDKMDYCEDCMNEITAFIKSTPKMKAKKKPAKEKPVQVKGGDKSPRTGRKPIDRGKIRALHEAGWTMAKIADDVQCSIATVNNVLKEAKQNGNNEKA